MRAFRFIASAVVSGLSVLALPGCGGSEPETPPGVVVDEYTVRGVIVSVPSYGDPSGDLMVHHEAIPDFRGEGGARGMNEMVMPFPVASGLDLSEFSEGDRVSLTFTVDYNENEDRLITYRATSIELLPEGATLDFDTDESDSGSSNSDGG